MTITRSSGDRCRTRICVPPRWRNHISLEAARSFLSTRRATTSRRPSRRRDLDAIHQRLRQDAGSASAIHVKAQSHRADRDASGMDPTVGQRVHHRLLLQQGRHVVVSSSVCLRRCMLSSAATDRRSLVARTCVKGAAPKATTALAPVAYDRHESSNPSTSLRAREIGNFLPGSGLRSHGLWEDLHLLLACAMDKGSLWCGDRVGAWLGVTPRVTFGTRVDPRPAHRRSRPAMAVIPLTVRAAGHGRLVSRLCDWGEHQGLDAFGPKTARSQLTKKDTAHVTTATHVRQTVGVLACVR